MKFFKKAVDLLLLQQDEHHGHHHHDHEHNDDGCEAEILTLCLNKELFPAFAKAHFRCAHKIKTEPFAVDVRGHTFNNLSELRACPDCVTDYLNRHATVCGICKVPILPGELVSRAPEYALHVYAHAKEAEDAFCGRWGESALLNGGNDNV